MKILFIVPYVPSRIYVRPYQLMRGLIARGHEVALATLTGDSEDRDFIQHLQDEGVDVYAHEQPISRSLFNAAAALPGRTPLQAVYSWQPALARTIARLLSPSNGKPPFDAVHVEHLRGARYALFVRDLRQQPEFSYLNTTPLIWDSVDSITHLFRQASKNSQKITSRLITTLELPRTARYEAYLAGQFDHMLVTSPVDQQAFQEIHQSKEYMAQAPSPITILPNGVDLAYFRPDPTLPKEEQTLVVSGKMSYHANVTMVHFLVREVMPFIWSKKPGVKLWIVGKNPGRALRQLEENPQIAVTGTVPDLRPYLQRASIAVAPIQYGAGIQNKVLEAMACGTAVICSSRAVSALQVQPGRHLVTADQPQTFANAVMDLLTDGTLRTQISQAGRNYVETHHDWDQIAARLEDIYENTRQRLQQPTED